MGRLLTLHNNSCIYVFFGELKGYEKVILDDDNNNVWLRISSFKFVFTIISLLVFG